MRLQRLRRTSKLHICMSVPAELAPAMSAFGLSPTAKIVPMGVISPVST